MVITRITRVGGGWLAHRGIFILHPTILTHRRTQNPATWCKRKERSLRRHPHLLPLLHLLLHPLLRKKRHPPRRGHRHGHCRVIALFLSRHRHRRLAALSPNLGGSLTTAKNQKATIRTWPTALTDGSLPPSKHPDIEGVAYFTRAKAVLSEIIAAFRLELLRFGKLLGLDPIVDLRL